MNHLMIDLETMGNGHDAAITQVGGVVFDPELGTLLEEYGAHVRLESSVAAGLKIDSSTVRWWMEQEQAARMTWLGGQAKAYALSRALHELGILAKDSKPVGVWSHGSTFDIPILNTAYRSFGHPMPWGFRDVRDTRTLVWLCGDFDPWKEDPVPGDVKHDAMSDARRQARMVIRALKHLRGQQ